MGTYPVDPKKKKKDRITKIKKTESEKTLSPFPFSPK